MNFSWQRVCDRYGIEYVVQGPNTAKGNISIHCPFCGNSDHSEHLGLSLDSTVWGCWRDSSHRGKSPVRLIRALLRCSIEEARRISGVDVREDTESFDSIDPTKIFDEIKEQKKSHLLCRPSNFRDLDDSFNASKRFRRYLLDRGFGKDEIWGLIEDYDLQYCVTGVWSERLIIPIHYQGRLVTWTGRDIRSYSKLRYRTLSPTKDDEEGNIAVENIKHVLFDYDLLKYEGGKILFITEGPMDAINFGFKCRDYPVQVTCLFSMTISEEQVLLLASLKDKFDKIVVLLDSKEIGAAMKMESDLRFLGVKAMFLPEHIEDPGSMTRKEVCEIVELSLK